VVLASSNFLVPNGTFVVELLAFLIVVGGLGKYVLPFITEKTEERQATIRQALADAEEAKRKNVEAEAEAKRIVGEAHAQARATVDQANKQAEQLRADKRQQADREYDQRVAQAATDIEVQARRAREDLRNQVADLAITVAEKVLGENLDPETHRSAVQRAISEVESA
jgi:F-type H+-transporting ATPase subunit b